jgi:hypothetical protein
MRTILISLFIFSFSFLEARPLFGYILFKDGTVQKVLFDIPFVTVRNRPDFHKIQKKVKYQYNFRSHVLWPDGADGYMFFNEGDTVRMLSLQLLGNKSSNGYEFTKVHLDGKITLFDYFVPLRPKPQYIIQTENDFLLLNDQNYAGAMLDLTTRCKDLFDGYELTKDIHNDIPKFVAWYNENCGG